MNSTPPLSHIRNSLDFFLQQAKDWQHILDPKVLQREFALSPLEEISERIDRLIAIWIHTNEATKSIIAERVSKAAADDAAAAAAAVNRIIEWIDQTSLGSDLPPLMKKPFALLLHNAKFDWQHLDPALVFELDDLNSSTAGADIVRALESFGGLIKDKTTPKSMVTRQRHFGK